MRPRQIRAGHTTGNRGGSWLLASALLVVTLLVMILSPMTTIAEGEAEGPAQGLVQAPAETDVPASAPQVIAAPTEIPVVPTAVPVVPTTAPALPTVVPVIPTEAPVQPTMVPTAEPTGVPVVTPTVEPTEAPKVWINTDTNQVSDGITAHTIQQGGSATVQTTYAVTTPRISTTVFASLSGAVEGWSLSSPTLADADGAAASASWTQTTTLEPGATFTLPIVITAPAALAKDQSVTLQLWSVAAGTNGQETGVANTGTPIATITAIAPAPTPTPVTVQPRMLAATADISIACTQITSVAPANITILCDPDATNSEIAKAPFDLSGITLSEGWSYSIVEKDTGWIRDTTVTGVSDASIKNPKITIRLKIDSELQTSTVALDFWAAANKPKDTRFHFTFTGTVQLPPRPGDMTTTCTPDPITSGANVETIVSCVVSDVSLRSPVTISTADIVIPAGWSASGGTQVGQVLSVNVNKTLSTGSTVTFQFTMTRTGCAIATSLTVKTWYVSGTAVAAPGPEDTVTIQNPTVAPSLSLSGPINFGTLTWDGLTYGSRTQTLTATINRAGACGGAYNINLSVVSENAVMKPQLTDVREGSDELSVINATGDPNIGPITVARVSPTFVNTGNVEMDLKISPGAEADPGSYSGTVHVKLETGN